jgi:hypothetical protein
MTRAAVRALGVARAAALHELSPICPHPTPIRWRSIPMERRWVNEVGKVPTWGEAGAVGQLENVGLVAARCRLLFGALVSPEHRLGAGPITRRRYEAG